MRESDYCETVLYDFMLDVWKSEDNDGVLVGHCIQIPAIIVQANSEEELKIKFRRSLDVYLETFCRK